MKKKDLQTALFNELNKAYHNARLSSIKCENQKLYEEFDLYLNNDYIPIVMKEIINIKFAKFIEKYGEIYSYGRMGATLLCKDLTEDLGCRWSIKYDIGEELDYKELLFLYRSLRRFNKFVKEFCSSKNLEILYKEFLEQRDEEE